MLSGPRKPIISDTDEEDEEMGAEEEEDEEEEKQVEEKKKSPEEKEKPTIPSDIPIIAANPDDIDDEEVGMMMEEEEYANKQLQLMALQLAKEKERKKHEEQKEKIESSFSAAPITVPVPASYAEEPKKRGRRKKFVEGVSPLKQQLQQQQRIPPLIISKALITPPPVLNNEEIEKEKLIIPTENVSLVPTVVQDLSITPAKRRGRKSKKTLEAEAAAAEAAKHARNGNVQPITSHDGRDPNLSANSLESGYPAGKLSIASAPQPFSQSQPTPSVITRMLQSQPLPTQPFTSAANAMNQKYFGSVNEQPREVSDQFANMGQGSRSSNAYRQGPYLTVRQDLLQNPPSRLRSPGQQNMQQMFHSHHPLDPSPSGGGHVMSNVHGNRLPLENKGHTPPPPYNRSRFPGSDSMAGPRSSPSNPSREGHPSHYRLGIPGNPRYAPAHISNLPPDGQSSHENKSESTPPPPYARMGMHMGTNRFSGPQNVSRDGTIPVEGRSDPNSQYGRAGNNRYSDANESVLTNVSRDGPIPAESRNEPSPQYTRPNVTPVSFAGAHDSRPTASNIPNISRDSPMPVENRGDRGELPQYSVSNMPTGNRFPNLKDSGSTGPNVSNLSTDGPGNRGGEALSQYTRPNMPSGSAGPNMSNVSRDGPESRCEPPSKYTRPNIPPGSRFPKPKDSGHSLNIPTVSKDGLEIRAELSPHYTRTNLPPGNRYTGVNDPAMPNVSRETPLSLENRTSMQPGNRYPSINDSAMPNVSRDTPISLENRANMPPGKRYLCTNDSPIPSVPRDAPISLEKRVNMPSASRYPGANDSAMPSVPRDAPVRPENRSNMPPGSRYPGTSDTAIPNVSRGSPVSLENIDESIPSPQHSKSGMPLTKNRFTDENSSISGLSASINQSISREAPISLENRSEPTSGSQYTTPGPNQFPTPAESSTSTEELSENKGESSPSPQYAKPNVPQGNNRFAGANEVLSQPNLSTKIQNKEKSTQQYAEQSQSSSNDRSSDSTDSLSGHAKPVPNVSDPVSLETRESAQPQYNRPVIPSGSNRFSGSNDSGQPLPNLPNISRENQPPFENKGESTSSQNTRPALTSGNKRYQPPNDPMADSSQEEQPESGEPTALSQYNRPSMSLGSNRFTSANDSIPGPTGPNVRPQHVTFPTGNRMQPSSPPRTTSGETYAAYNPPAATNYPYGSYPQSLTAADDALPPTAYQSSSYPEQYNNPTDNSGQNSEGSNSKTFDEEESGEFGGLVSYFSSQREDDLDA